MSCSAPLHCLSLQCVYIIDADDIQPIKNRGADSGLLEPRRLSCANGVSAAAVV